jgi:predicted nucleotidyltransferase
MTGLIDRHRGTLGDLCRRYRVQTLELFGSGADETFDSVRSDLDFLVEFQPMPPGDHSRAYFDLWFALEDLFGRKVDLVERPAVTNPYFLKAIGPSRRVLYAG